MFDIKNLLDLNSTQLSKMKSSISEYQIEKNEILRKAYQLLVYFLANEQIARIANPNESNDPLKALDARFLFQETSVLILEVAILFRSLDDQFKKLKNNLLQEEYFKKLESTNERYDFDIIDKISLRECCNKIIHATTFEPCIVEELRPHTKDLPAFYGGDEKEIIWHHLDGNIRISGTKNDNEWVYIISVPEFVGALAYLLE